MLQQPNAAVRQGRAARAMCKRRTSSPASMSRSATAVMLPSRPSSTLTLWPTPRWFTCRKKHYLDGLQPNMRMPRRKSQGLGLKLTCWQEPSLRISPGASGTS